VTGGDEQTGGTRRRGAALEATLLEAAWAELIEAGYARLTMEGVANRAHTGKQVLYRRWRNRAELVIAAMRYTTGSIADDIPDTGELRGDVLIVLGRILRRHGEIGSDVIHGLMADVPDIDPEFFTIMSDVMTTVLRQAEERGELMFDQLPPRVVTLPVDLVRHEILLARRPIGPHVLDEIVDGVFLPLVYATAGTGQVRTPNAPGANSPAVQRR
jgi:AcrR family transcriptional regulator